MIYIVYIYHFCSLPRSLRSSRRYSSCQHPVVCRQSARFVTLSIQCRKSRLLQPRPQHTDLRQRRLGQIMKWVDLDRFDRSKTDKGRSKLYVQHTRAGEVALGLERACPQSQRAEHRHSDSLCKLYKEGKKRRKNAAFQYLRILQILTYHS